jgi:hypothetical protein
MFVSDFRAPWSLLTPIVGRWAPLLLLLAAVKVQRLVQLDEECCCWCQRQRHQQHDWNLFCKDDS